MKSISKSPVITTLLWMIFGIITMLNFYSKEAYYISGFMAVFSLLYGYKTYQSIHEHQQHGKHTL